MERNEPPLFNEYAVLNRSRKDIQEIEEKLREVAELIIPIADTLSLVEARALWDDFAQELSGRAAEYRLIRAFALRKEKNGK